MSVSRIPKATAARLPPPRRRIAHLELDAFCSECGWTETKEAPEHPADHEFEHGYAGMWVDIGSMQGRDLIAFLRGTLEPADSLELLADRVMDHNIEVDSLLDLDAELLSVIMEAWAYGMENRALPKASAAK